MKAIYYTYPWAMDVPGGGERQLMAYRHHLNRYGIQADLFDMWEPRFDDYNIFHCFSVMPGVEEMLGYAKARGLKAVVSPNLWVPKGKESDYPVKEIWNCFEISDAIIVNSDMEGDRLSDCFGMNRNKFHTVYNGVDSDFLLPADPQVFRDKFSINESFVLNVGNVEKRKNQAAFIQALREERPDTSLVVIGNIRDRHYYDKCKEIGGDHFHCIGSLPYASELLRSALAACDLFAMPSLLETPSIAALEAAAYGKQILITSVGSTREYFGDSVAYVEPDSNESMKMAIRKAYESDPAHSTWRVRHLYMWSKLMNDLVSVYKNI